MRKEVKRSLFLWPAVASTAITAMSVLSTMDQTRFNRLQVRSVSLISHVVAMHTSVAAPRTDVELAERTERGTRAMKMPDRVAEVFGVEPETPQNVLMAPVRDVQRELAGLVLLPPRHRITVLEQPGAILRGDVLAADRVADSQTIAVDRVIDADALQGLRNRDHIESISVPPEFVGPLRPEPSIEESFVLEPPALRGPSLLPASNRLLGNRLLAKPAPLDSESPAEQASEELIEVDPFGFANDASNANEIIFEAPRLQSPSSPDPEQPREEPSSSDEDVVKGTPENEESNVEELPQQDQRDQQLAQQQTPTQKAADDTPPSSLDRSPAGWPLTRRLDEQVESLAVMGRSHADSGTTAPVVRWADEVAETLGELQSLPRLGDSQAEALLDKLAELAVDGERQAEQVTDREIQIQWLRASHAVARRIAVWRPVWQVTNGEQTTWMVSDQQEQPAITVAEAVEGVRADLVETGDSDGWEKYLLLDEVEQALHRGKQDQRTILAQRLLSRLAWHGLDPEHQRWLQRDAVTDLATAVQPWAREAVDYAALMGQIERQESNAIDMSAIEIAGAVQTLRFADSKQANSVADAINTYYRNANVRLAISQPMLNRLLPTMDPRSVPVKTQLFGSRVRGISRIESDLEIELEPSADKWSMKLKTLGKVRTQSTGINGAVSIRTAGNSGFVASKPIDVTQRGVKVGDSSVDVQGRTRLRGIRTGYDGWPLVGSLVRSIAEDRYGSLAGRSNRIANQKIKSQVRSEIDDQVDVRVGEATEQLSRMVLGPLGTLRLDPKVMDMQTTEQRLMARYRLAGDWQLGAFTPRPRALSTSLMSVQVHQSALNNTLEQLVPKGDSLTIGKMIENAAELFGQTDVTIPDDIPDGVTIQFAPTRPVTIEIEEEKLWITLRIVRLSRGDRVDLTNFIVRAAYDPQMDGLNATLVRDGHLRISGPGMSMRERLPVRAIFNKVLSPNRPFRLTVPQLMDHPAMEGLVVSQLELRDGWIGMAISNHDSPRIAIRKANEPTGAH